MSSQAVDTPTVRVQPDHNGRWEVSLPDRHAEVTCETLDDARRIGYLWAAHRHACELVVRDAYNRVVRREFIDGSESHPPKLR